MSDSDFMPFPFRIAHSLLLVASTLDALSASALHLPPSSSSEAEVLALKHDSRILGHSSNPVCGFSMMEQVRLCAVWLTKNWIGSSLNQIKG